jgi:hypothetical protein
MLDEGYLLECWRYIRKDAAYGVDKISAEQYERDLELDFIHLRGFEELERQR